MHGKEGYGRLGLVASGLTQEGQSLVQIQTAFVETKNVRHSARLTARRRNRRLSIGALTITLVMVLVSLVGIQFPTGSMTGQLRVSPDTSPAAPYLDGFGSKYCGGNSHSSCTATLFALNFNNLIFAFCTLSGTDLPTVGDSAGLTWMNRPYSQENVVEFYALAPTGVSDDSITCHSPASPDVNINLIVFGVSGASLNAPFDPSSSLPYSTSSSTGGTPTVNVPLSASPDLLLGYIAEDGSSCSTPSVGSGFSEITASGSPPCNEVEYEATSATGSHTVNFGSTGSHGYSFLVDAIEAASTPGVALDGDGSNYCGQSAYSSCTATLTTLNAGDLIIAFCTLSGNYLPSIGDSAGLTWMNRPYSQENVVEFYANAPSALTKDSITCNSPASPDVNINLIVYGVAGANLNAPFDPSSSLPYSTSSSTGGTPSVSVPLSASPDFLVGLVAEDLPSCSTPSVGSGFSEITASGSPPCNEVEYERTSAAGPYTVDYGSTGSNGYSFIVDAIQAAPNGCTGSVSFNGSPYAAAQSTNTSIQWYTALPPGCPGPVTTTLTWGTSTSYPFTAINGAPYYGSYVEHYAPLLDYLEPSTTYYYHLSGTESGLTAGNYYGSWTTGKDSMNEFQGIVEDVNGTVAPAGVYLGAECAGASTPAWTGSTGSGGVYALPVPTGCGSHGDEVDVMNGYYWNPFNDQWVWEGNGWGGRGNESLIVWNAQWMNFYLSTSVQTWVPQVYEFDNNGSVFPSFQFTGSASVTASNSYSFAGLSTSSSRSVTVSSSDGTPAGSGLELASRYSTTARVVFNAVTNRTPYGAGAQYWGPATSKIVTAPVISDWATVNQYGPASCAEWDTWVQRGLWHNDSMTITGSVSGTTGYAGTIDVGYEFPGSGVTIGTSIAFSIGITASTSSSATAEPKIYIPTSATYGWYEFDVCYQGDAGAEATSGLVAHVWQVGETNINPL